MKNVTTSCVGKACRQVLSVLLCAMLSLLMLLPGASALDEDVDIELGGDYTTVYYIANMAGLYKTEGRTSVVNHALMLDYSDSGFLFNAACSGDVIVTFQTTKIDSAADGGCYFTVIVDGVTQPRDFCRITNTGITKVQIAGNLAAGTHSFEIYRQTELERAELGITAVTLDGTLSNPPADKDLYIEFVGDSITTSIGNLCDGSADGPGNPLNQDATQGYAYLTARAMDADFSVVARQGIGASVGWQPVSMNVVYPLLRHARDAQTAYDFARQPDVVVIALGTNDMSRYRDAGKTLADVKQGFADLLNLVHTKNPNAKIVWMHGMMTNDADTIISEVIEEAGGAASGYYTLKTVRNNAGGQWHPDLAGHQRFAADLTAFLKTTVLAVYKPGDINNDTYVNLLDVTLLAKIVAKWDNLPAYVAAATNTDGQGETTLQDVVYLARCVAGWEGYTPQ